MLLMKKIKI